MIVGDVEGGDELDDAIEPDTMSSIAVVGRGSGRLDRVLTDALEGWTRARVVERIEAGAVTVDGVVARKASQPVREGALMSVAPLPTASEVLIPEPIPLSLLYVDDHLAVVDKPAGLVVHPGAGHASGTLVHGLLHALGALSPGSAPQRPGIVHRLDRGTSGLMVVARSPEAHAALAAQFAAHTARRRYLAITVGAPSEAKGTLVSHLGRHPVDRQRFASVDPTLGRHAVTHWELLAASRGLSLIRCVLETGRTHQIRVHLTEAGWPLAGDPLYRGRRAPEGVRDLLPPDRPMLHAWRLAFVHPATGERLTWETAPPEDFLSVLRWAELPVPPAFAGLRRTQVPSPALPLRHGR
jgi:23S rRNA pseudouridine1911/1915/1917 synthase